MEAVKCVRYAPTTDKRGGVYTQFSVPETRGALQTTCLQTTCRAYGHASDVNLNIVLRHRSDLPTLLTSKNDGVLVSNNL